MVGRCVVVTRELRGGSRIVETERAFTSVEELFAFCVGLQNPNIVDRLSISGRDADGIYTRVKETIEVLEERRTRRKPLKVLR